MLYLREIRLNLKKTQLQMANLLGISRASYSAYENGTRQPTPEMLNNISKTFNISIDYLLNGRYKDFTDIPEEYNYIIAIYKGLPDHLKVRGVALLEGLYLSAHKQLPEIVFKINKI